MDTRAWHDRFLQQAGWTRPLRDYLLAQFSARGEPLRRALDVGCGTGALLTEMQQRGLPEIIGLDISAQNLAFAATQTSFPLLQADGEDLPFADDSFDLAYCHFVMLWAANPIGMLAELRRIVRPGGIIAAFAEPDYGGRIDYPDPLARLAGWQTQSLIQQGADPLAGRHLLVWFRRAGLAPRGGIFGAQWDPAQTTASTLERQTLQADLAALQPPPDPAEIEYLLNLDAAASASGERLLYVPTCYAWAVV